MSDYKVLIHANVPAGEEVITGYADNTIFAPYRNGDESYNLFDCADENNQHLKFEWEEVK